MAYDKAMEIFRSRMSEQWRQEQEDKQKRYSKQQAQARVAAREQEAQQKYTQWQNIQQTSSADIMGKSAAKSYGMDAKSYSLLNNLESGAIPKVYTRYTMFEPTGSPLPGQSKERNALLNARQSELTAERLNNLSERQDRYISEINTELQNLMESAQWPEGAPVPGDERFTEYEASYSQIPETAMGFNDYAKKYNTLPSEMKNAYTDKAVQLWNALQDAENYKKTYTGASEQYGDQKTMYDDLAEYYRMPEAARERIRNLSLRLETAGAEKNFQYSLLGLDDAEDALSPEAIDYLMEQGLSKEEAKKREREIAISYGRYDTALVASQIKENAYKEVGSGAGNAVWANAKSIGANVANSFFGVIGTNQVNDSRYSTANPNSPFFAYGNYASAVRGKTKEQIETAVPGFGGKILSTLYSGGMSSIDNGLRILIGGETGSLALAGLSSFSDGFQEATERGGNELEAILFGGASAALEIVTEKISLDRLLKETNPKAIREIVTSALKQGAVEVSEEEASYFGGLIADYIIMGDKSQFNDSIRTYMAEGMSFEDAQKKALDDNMEEFVRTAAESMVSGAMMAGVTQTKRYAWNANQGKTLSENERQALLSQAEKLQDTESNRMAGKGNVDSRNAYFGALQGQVQQDISQRITGAETAEELFNLYREAIAETTPGVEAAADLAFMGRAQEMGQDVGDSAAAYATGAQIERQNRQSTGESWVDLILRRQYTADSAVERILNNESFRQEFAEKTGVEVPEVTLKGKNRSSQADINQAKRIVTNAIKNQEQRTQAYRDVYQKNEATAQEAAPEAQTGEAEERPLSAVSRENVTTPLPSPVSARVSGGEEAVEITGIKFRDGQMVAETSGGDFTLPELSISAGDKMGQVLNIAAGYGGNIARNFLSNYDGETYPKTYWDAYNAFLSAGKLAAGTEAMTFERAAAVNDAYARVLPQRAQMEAFSVGRESARAEEQAVKATVKKARKGQGTVEDKTTKKTPEQDSIVKLLGAYAKRTGIDVTILDSIRKGDAKANGSFVAATMSMYLSSEADNVLQTLGHESGEFISAFAPEEKAAIRDTVLKWWAYHENLNAVDQLIRKYQEKYAEADGSKTYNQAADEVINDALGALLTTETGQKQFVDWISKDNTMDAGKKKSLVQSIKNAVRKILDGLNEYLKRKGVSEETRRFLKMEVSQQEKLMKQFFHALDVAVENSRDTGEYVEESAASYSLSFEEESELLLSMGETAESREERWRSSFAEGAEVRTQYQMIEAESEAAMEELARTARGISTMEERLATQEALQRVSSATQDMVEYWRSQTKPHKGKTFQEASGKIARELKNSYQSQMNVNELSRGLQEIYNTLYSKGYEAAVEKAVELSKKLISKSIDTSGSLYEDYADARKYFRDKTVTISAEDAHDIPDFRDFQKRNFGRLKIGISYNRQQATIDGDFSEMAEMMPGFLDTTNTLAASDKLLAVAEALDAIYADRGVNPYEGSISETVNESALDMIQLVTGEFAEETFADKQAKALQDAVTEAKTEAQTEIQRLRDEAKRASLEAENTIAQLRNSVRAERMGANTYLEQAKASKAGLEAAEQTVEQLRKQLKDTQERLQKAKGTPKERDAKRLADEMFYGRKAREGAVQEMERQKDRFAREQQRLQEAHRKAMDKELKRHETQLKNAEKRIQKAKDKLEKYRGDRDERDAKIRLRASVERKAKRLTDMIVKNDAKTHMPEAFKKIVGDFLLSLDFESKRLREGGKPTVRDRSYTDSLTRLKDALADQAKYLEGAETEGGLDLYIDLPSGFVAAMKEHIEAIQKATEGIELGVSQVYEMTSQQLRQLDEILTTISTSIANANLRLADENGKTVSEAGKSTMKGLGEIGPASSRTGKTSNFLQWDNATPYYAFQRFEEGGKEIFNALSRGWDKMAMNVKRVIDFSASTYTEKEVKSWGSEVHEIKLSSNRTVKMTTAQIMSLYCLAKREQAMGHLMGGGMRIGNFQEGGKTISQADPVILTLEDLSKITKKLTVRQKEVANKLQKFMNTVGSKWGNEISAKRFGTLQFTEANYFPIESDSTNLPARDPGSMENSMFRLLNLSMTKSLTYKANNAIVVNDIFNVFSNHMADMAKYNALALPILDAMKWYNYKETVTTADGKVLTQTVQRSMEKAYGRAANQYFTTFMKDLNGVSEGGRGEGLANRMISNYKIAAVGANLRVAILQPTAYVRAMAVISPRYLTRAFSMKNGYKEMLQYSGIATWKDMGFYDTNIGRGIREQIKGETTFKDKAVEKLMFLAELGDKLTWGRLWNACKLEAMEKTGLRGVELNRAVADRFREVVYATQVVDSTMTRSQIMRSKSNMAKMLTSFMSEPTISYNLLMNSYTQFSQEARRTGDRGKAWSKTKGAIMRGITAYSVTAVAAALAESLWDAWRDDDEYETFMDKFLQALFGWDGNLAQDLFPFSKIPYLKDVTSILTGYDVDRMDMESIKNLYDAYQILAEKIRLKTGKQEDPTSITYYGKMTDYGAISKALKALSQATGLPGYSLTREVIDIWNHTGGLVTGEKIRTYEPSSETAIQEAYAAGNLTREEALEKLQEKVTDKDGNAISQDDAYWKLRSWETGSSSKLHTLTGALIAGEPEGIQEAKQELLAHGYETGDMDSLFTKAIGEAYKKDADGNYGNGRISRKQAEKYLLSYTGKNEKEVYKTLQEWDYAIENEGTDGFSVYNDLHSAIEAGGNLDKEKQALVSGGYSEKDINSEVKSYIGKLYKNGDFSKSDAQKLLGEYLGIDDEKELYDTFREWDYAAENGSGDGFSLYMDVDAAVEAWKPIDSIIRELTAHGYKESDIRSEAVSYVGKLFLDGKISETKAGQLYVKYASLDEDGNKPDENDVYWKLKEWKYKKANPDAEGYSRFDSLFTAIDNGANLSASIQEYLEHGYESKDLSSQITREYKKQFVKLWNSNRGQAEKLLEKLLDAYEALGYSRSKKREDILDWLEES